MRSDFFTRHVLLSILLVVAAACGAEPPEDWAQSQSAQVSPVPQANDRVFVVRASLALLGRPPRDAAELATFTTQMGTSTVPDDRRLALADFLMLQEDFVRHWTSVLYDQLRVWRDQSLSVPFGRTNGDCWNVATGAPRALADYVATTPSTFPGPPPLGVNPNFSMLDVMRTSVDLGDLRNPMRANLLAQMSSPLPGNQMTERNIRADYWTRFERSYLNRKLECLTCHNTMWSITGTASDWNRFYPLPDRVEEATLGSVDGSLNPPPDLMADFRFNGVGGFFDSIPGGNSFHPNTTGLQPWQMNVACGAFATTITGETNAQCPATPPEDLPPDNISAQQDVCITQGATRRAPVPRFGNKNPAVGSVFRLEQMFVAGAQSLAETGLPPETAPTRVIEPAELSGDRGFAIMTAAAVVERIWEEVFGSRLTLAHYYPRHPDQRNVLYELTRTLIQSSTEIGTPWSLKYLLRTILLRPEFNAATGIGDEYGLGVIFNPWDLADPRSSENDCATTAPTFERCVRGLLRKHTCEKCHNEFAGKVRPDWFFRHDDFVRITATVDDPNNPQIPLVISTQACQASDCAADVDCAAIGGKAASRIAWAVNCPDAGASLMPPGARMPEADRQAIFRWVANNNSTQGTPFPIVDPPAANKFNGIGDRAHWKSPFQLTMTAGRALLETATTDSWPQPFPGVGYPSTQIAQLAGQYLDDGKPGGRGFSLLTYLDWERTHAAGGGPCRFGIGTDRIDAMVANAQASATPVGVGQLIGDLKLSLLGESTFDDVVDAQQMADEAVLLDGVLASAGVTLATTVSPANAAAVNGGLRNVCNVFIRSPLFMLSYLESPLEPVMFLAGGRGHGRHGGHGHGGHGGHPSQATLWPVLCAGRLDCRADAPLVESTLGECWDDPRSCRGGARQAAADQVRDTLEDRRLPVERPAMDLERARTELPAAVPSENDPRLSSPVLILPLDGGGVTRLRGRVVLLSGSAFRPLQRGASIAYGDVLFIPRGAHLRIEANGQVFETGPRGMERPPEFDDLDDDDGHGHGRHHRRFHRRLHHGRGHHDNGPDSIWMVLANGAQARIAPHPARDPSISIGLQLAPGQGPRDGFVPTWARFGEARLWHTIPQ